MNVPDNGHFPGIPGKTKTEQVLQFALTLEILEADLYRQALNFVAGQPAATALPADTSSYALSVPPGGFTSDQAALGFLYLQQFAAVEAAHRDFLVQVINGRGWTPVAANPGGYQANFGPTLRSTLELIRRR